MTRPKRSTRRDKRSKMLGLLREADTRFGPDRAETVYTFNDGWTIRRATCASDAHRDGMQMFNCLRHDDPECPLPLDSLYRERRVLALRYGIGDDRERTLAEVAAVFGCQRERVRLIELQALAKLGDTLEADALRDAA
jgi:hypothetical protein